ncbi:MAG: class I SAM-dependent methyltransferase [Alphaproteobacteria bacterium]|jgi:hypothetical protein
MEAPFKQIVREQQAWAVTDSLDFFASHRQSVDDLYPSERVFLPDVATGVDTVLDVGCACGGFVPILHSFNPRLAYFGVDVIPAMIAEARRRHPRGRYTVAAGHALPFRSQGVDLVHCSGVVHLNSDFKTMIAEMWRVAGEYLLFDMRLTEGASVAGEFTVSFEDACDETGDGTGCGHRLLPYHVVNFEEARQLINALAEPPVEVDMFAYHHAPSPQSSFDPDTRILMAFLLLRRRSDNPGWHSRIDGRDETTSLRDN